MCLEDKNLQILLHNDFDLPAQFLLINNVMQATKHFFGVFEKPIAIPESTPDRSWWCVLDLSKGTSAGFRDGFGPLLRDIESAKMLC